MIPKNPCTVPIQPLHDPSNPKPLKPQRPEPKIASDPRCKAVFEDLARDYRNALGLKFRIWGSGFWLWGVGSREGTLNPQS